ncbi:MAG TPA: histidine phosphatase family protein [Steroidobacteraceae bacterium]
MKQLTLVRHADAQWKDPQIADFERPLNRRGMAEAQASARRLIELGLLPALLLTSPARRAHQTAEILARGLSLSPRSVRAEESLYLAGAPEILSVIQALGPRIPHVMLIGHNPGISEAVQLLAPQYDVQPLSTGAMCSMRFDARKWPGVNAATLQALHNEAPAVSLFRMWA